MDNSKSPQPLKKSRTALSGMDDHQLENDEFPSETDKGHDEFGEDNSPSLQHSIGPNYRGSPCIGAFTIQCAKCFKWRLIPTKEKYEEIREHIIQDPFDCERAREWRPDVTCDDPEDISQDGSRLWAIDKPNIAQPPSGWERQIRIRGEGGTKFADVYYTAPTGRKLRSLVEVDRYLSENPHYAAQGVALAQFSFQIPRPLRQNYVKKRPKIASDEAMPKPLQTVEANPIAWAAPPTHEGQTIGLSSGADEPIESEVELVRKAKAERSPSGEAKTNHVSDGRAVKSENAQNGDASTT
uniref:Uncharacterized protein n=1 Tax=Avena sativa TaxID=4498 RepID=A0ACD5YDR8_AVESA